MKDDDYRAYFLDLVCRIFSVGSQQLLKGSRVSDVVDARCALVHVLTLQGMTKKHIEQWTGIGPSGQAYLLEGFRLRSQNPWYRHLIVAMIKDAKETCPIAFKAHDRDGNLVLHLSKFE